MFGWTLDAVTVAQVLGGAGGLTGLIRFGPKLMQSCARIANANWRAARLQDQIEILERDELRLTAKIAALESRIDSADGGSGSAGITPTPTRSRRRSSRSIGRSDAGSTGSTP